MLLFPLLSLFHVLRCLRSELAKLHIPPKQLKRTIKKRLLQQLVSCGLLPLVCKAHAYALRSRLQKCTKVVFLFFPSCVFLPDKSPRLHFADRRQAVGLTLPASSSLSTCSPQRAFFPTPRFLLLTPTFKAVFFFSGFACGNNLGVPRLLH